MSFPDGLKTVELRFGEWMTAAGRRVDDSVVVAPPQDVVYTPTGDVVLRDPVRVPIRYGSGSVVLPATDAPGLSVQGFTYQVTARGRTVNISLPAAVPVVDFDLAVPVEPEPGTIVYAPPAGVPGPPNSLSIGTVTTGDAGTAAAATLTGQPPSQVLNLTIPRGVNGDGAVIKAGTGLTVSGAGTAANPLVVAQADTGWRNVDSLLVNGWTGNVMLRRVSTQVICRLHIIDPKAKTSTVFMTIPNGFRASRWMYVYVGQWVLYTGNGDTLQFDFTQPSDVQWVNGYVDVSWLTPNAWPTTLPGTPA